jgi:hypothetical protein
VTEVSDEFRRRWKSGQHTATLRGSQRPSQVVMVRTGEYRRGYSAWTTPTVNADIDGESRRRPWQATWHPTSAWKVVPGVSAINFDQDFDTNGTTAGTIIVENVRYVEKTGTLGELYHLIERGGLSPTRGYRAPQSSLKPPAKNEWYGKLAENSQIKVWQGYGDEQAPTFIGFIDKVTPGAKPDNLTLSLRDVGGKVLADSHMFGWNVSKQLPQPIRFKYDGRTGTRVGTGAEASSSRDGHPPRFASDTSAKTEWLSGTRGDKDVTEWIQVRLPRGTYSSFVLHPAYAGMEVYVGIYARARGGAQAGGAAYKPPTWDGEDQDEGWLRAHSGDVVPGEDNGGWHFIRHYNSHSDKQRVHELPGVFELGDDSVLRIGFRRLGKVGDGSYRAGAVRLQAVKDPAPAPKDPKDKSKLVLVKDLSDIVRCVLRWAGFKDWKVDDTGIEIGGDPIAVNREQTYMDVINLVLDIVGSFIFYIEPPTDDEDSLGLPVFRQSNVLADAADDMALIRDTDLLTDIDVNLTDEPKSYIIRVRGRPDKKGLTIGKTLDAGRTLMAVYRPPWSSGRRMSRIIRRHAIMAEPKIKTQLGCETAARLIAYKQALQGATATVDIPGTPEFDIDAQIGLLDSGTGTATRLYIVRRSSTASYGQNSKWMLSLGGSLVDHIDVIETKRDLQKLYPGQTIGDMKSLA